MNQNNKNISNKIIKMNILLLIRLNIEDLEI